MNPVQEMYLNTVNVLKYIKVLEDEYKYKYI